jgi:hypothetical protein
VLSTIYLNGNETVDLVTISNGTATDRHLLDKQPVSVLDANQRIALITTNNGTRLATLDLDTAAIRALGVNSPGGLGPGALSPDGTRAAVAARHADLATYEILIVDLASSTAHPLLEVSTSAYNRAGLDPIRWTNAGILVSPGVWDGGRSTLLNLDPQSANLTKVTDAGVGVLSPGATMMAAVGYAQLGDGPHQGQGGWHNQLSGGPVGPPLVVIAEQKNRDFSAFDIADDGTVLYRADGAPFSGTGLNDATPAPDMGIYLATGGQSIQELGETHIGQWGAGALVGPGMALLTKVATQGEAGVAEIDLVNLCSISGCNANVQPVTTVSGAYPEPRLILLRPTKGT